MGGVSMHETPEQFETRTGAAWKNDSAVYMQIGKNRFRVKPYYEAKLDAECCEIDKHPYIIYCANSDDGIPESPEGAE